MNSTAQEIDLDLIEFLTEFCLNEIALEGLQGNSFDLFIHFSTN